MAITLVSFSIRLFVSGVVLTVAAPDTSFVDYLCLAVDDLDGFYRALSDTGVTYPATILDRKNQLFSL